MKILCVAHEEDEVAIFAVQTLYSLGYHIDILERAEPAPHGSIVFFGSEGRFPNRYLREVQARDKELRGIARPEWSAYAARSFALAKSQFGNMKLSSRLRNFQISLITAIEPREISLKPSSHLRPRTEWKSGHQARRRQEFRTQLGL